MHTQTIRTPATSSPCRHAQSGTSRLSGALPLLRRVLPAPRCEEGGTLIVGGQPCVLVALVRMQDGGWAHLLRPRPGTAAGWFACHRPSHPEHMALNPHPIRTIRTFPDRLGQDGDHLQLNGQALLLIRARRLRDGCWKHQLRLLGPSSTPRPLP
jgi:hypothetical protein